MVTGWPSSFPVNISQRARVPQTSSPRLPSLLTYSPVPSGFLRAGCSSDRARRRASIPSLLSGHLHRRRTRGQRGDAIDRPPARPGGEHEAGVLDQGDAPIGHHPVGHDGQLALPAAALRRLDLLVDDRAVLAARRGVADAGRVAPEVDVVDVAIVEPQPEVVGMVLGLVGALFQRPAAGDGLAGGGEDGEQHRLGQLGIPAVGGERLPVDADVHPLGGFDRLDLHLRSGRGGRRGRQR